jgi:HSP20 family protein
LSISGERKYETDQNENNAQRIERFYGKFYRSFNFPASVNGDAIKASYRDGVLTVTVPKAEEVKPKQIEIA